MTGRTSLRWGVSIAAALFLGAAAFAEEPAPPAPAEPTSEQRKQMAETHRKMAECLLSERPFAECRAEMHARCQEQMGPEGCPMMGGGMGMGMGRGMRRGPGMMGEPSPAPNEPPATSPEPPATK